MKGKLLKSKYLEESIKILLEEDRKIPRTQRFWDNSKIKDRVSDKRKPVLEDGRKKGMQIMRRRKGRSGEKI